MVLRVGLIIFLYCNYDSKQKVVLKRKGFNVSMFFAHLHYAREQKLFIDGEYVYIVLNSIACFDNQKELNEPACIHQQVLLSDLDCFRDCSYIVTALKRYKQWGN